jgi:hypothetical protein
MRQQLDAFEPFIAATRHAYIQNLELNKFKEQRASRVILIFVRVFP